MNIDRKAKNVLKNLDKFEETIIKNKNNFDSESDYNDVLKRVSVIKNKINRMKNIDDSDTKALESYNDYLQGIAKELKIITKKSKNLAPLLLAAVAVGIFANVFFNIKGMKLDLSDPDFPIKPTNLKGFIEIAKYVTSDEAEGNRYIKDFLAKLGIGSAITGVGTHTVTKKLMKNKKFINASRTYLKEEKKYFNY